MNRIQVSTYISSEEDHEQWAAVKEHYGEGDSAILRQLIREKYQDINGGNTKRQILPRILDELLQLRTEVKELRERVVSLESKLQSSTQ